MALIDPAFWNQPIDLILYEMLVWFGWIPLTATILRGLVMVWKNHRQGIFAGTLQFVLLAVDVPALTEQTPKALESMFASLSSAFSNFNWKETWMIGKFQPSFSFEIVSAEGYVQFYVRCQSKFRDAVEAGIYAHYPDAEISEVEDYAANFPTHFPNDTHEAWGMELSLKEDQIFPIRTYADFEDKISGELKDPLGQTLEQLSKMRPGEYFCIQYLCQVTNNKWKDAGIEFINKVYGVTKPHKESGFLSGARTLLSIPDEVLAKTLGISISGLFLGPAAAPKSEDQWKAFKLTASEKEQAEAVLEKIAKPGMLVKTRVVYVARKEAFNKGARALFIKGLLTQYSHLGLNSFSPAGSTVPKDDYFWQKWSYTAKQHNLMTGYVNRSMGIGATPKILNTEELTSLWHLPAIGVKAPLIKKAEARRGEPPVGLPVGVEGDDVVLAGVAKSLRQQQASDAAHGVAASADHHDQHAQHGVHSDAGGELPHPTLPGMTPLQVVATDVHGDPHAHTPADDHQKIDTPHTSVPDPFAHALPSLAIPSVKSAEPTNDHEEIEDGLDATDMGPPADIILPGPPPGWKESEETPATQPATPQPPLASKGGVREEAPTIDHPPVNLPM